MLLLSPKTKYYPDFLPNGDDLFVYLNDLDGWKKNTYNGYKLNRETIVFATEEIVNNPDRFKIPDIWGKDVIVMIFPPELQQVLDQLYILTKVKYNIALGNRYLKATDRISFHSDNEEFGNTQSIASLSLGVTRLFTFMSKNIGEKITLNLEHGSLLFMGENCQENYTHGMMKEKIETHPLFDKTRINITFRVWNY